MLGSHAQQGLLQADNLYLDFVGRNSFYGHLASLRGELFRDEDFSDLYCPDNGRPGVAPSILATALLLQAHDKVSDNEAKQRADFDLRWKVALGTAIDDRPFAKSTLQLFRTQLILHGKMQAVFKRSLEHARESGHLKGRRMKLALDTTAILGRGAQRDAYNLIGDGCRLLIGALSELDGRNAADWAAAEGYALHAAKSLKGRAAIDWSSRKARRRLLKRIVSDADSLLGRARAAIAAMDPGDERARDLADNAALLSKILLQDIERRPDPDSDGDGPAIRKGGGRDRTLSVHDPEMRHGRKSARQRFAGHKGAVAVDTGSGLITAVGVIPGNAPDAAGALELVREAEDNAGVSAETVVADCAYGDGLTREEFAEAGYDLLARAPGRPRSDRFVKEDFRIDLGSMTCTCPAGQVTADLRAMGSRRLRSGERIRDRYFRFNRAACAGCELRPRCVRSATGSPRTVRFHPQERLLQRARDRQRSPAGQALLKSRLKVEHRLARLVQLGIRQSRFCGRSKTLYQLLMAATVANLTLTAGRTGALGPQDPDMGPDGGGEGRSRPRNRSSDTLAARITGSLADACRKTPRSAAQSVLAAIRVLTANLLEIANPGCLNRGFRPGF